MWSLVTGKLHPAASFASRPASGRSENRPLPKRFDSFGRNRSLLIRQALPFIWQDWCDASELPPRADKRHIKVFEVAACRIKFVGTVAGVEFEVCRIDLLHQGKPHRRR